MTRAELLAAAKPILLNTEMVKATLDGKKSCARRVVRLKDVEDALNDPARIESHKISDNRCIRCLCTAPYAVGDILYVRETWRVRNVYGDIARHDRTAEIEFKAGGNSVFIAVTEDAINGSRWHPSIHMPKSAARLFLRVKSVRVERLQKIRPSGAINEGACEAYEIFENMVPMFAKLWNSTIKHADLPLYGWDANPWVRVLEFERVTADD